MNYVVCAQDVKIDLMVEQEFYPQLVSYVQRMGCSYTKERTAKPGNGRVYKVLKDIHGKGGAVGELLGLFYSLEWGALKSDKDARKFYIMINPARKGKKKDADKNRKKAGQGSNSGNSGESSGYSEPGSVGGPAGDGFDAGLPIDNDLWDFPRVE